MSTFLWPEGLRWIGFNVLVLALLALDLGLFHRKAHAVRVKEALAWSAVWIALALAFNLGLYFWKGGQVALEFLTGYLIEKSLSVDNLFVFAALLAYFRVPAAYQHKVLFWGILGALVMRGAFIALGSAALHRFHAAIYVFGGILIVSAVKLALAKETGPDPEHHRILRLVRKVLPLARESANGRFFVHEGKRRRATPLFLALISVELTDVVFAVDSIPAIFAVTDDPFIVYTSNAFAILGLRSLYFALAGALGKFRFLKPGLALILAFVGVKMILSGFTAIPVAVALGVVAGILIVSVLASILWPAKAPAAPSAEADAPPVHPPPPLEETKR